MYVSIDKAHLQKDLRFEYVEDPTITRIEPEWSIYRYSTRAATHLFILSVMEDMSETWQLNKDNQRNIMFWSEKIEFKAS